MDLFPFFSELSTVRLVAHATVFLVAEVALFLSFRLCHAIAPFRSARARLCRRPSRIGIKSCNFVFEYMVVMS